MITSLNVNEEAYGMMLKTKRILTANSKRNSASCQKLLPFLMRQKKDNANETQFTESRPLGPPRVRPFLRSSLSNENSQTVNSNVSIIRRFDIYLIHYEICIYALKRKKKAYIYKI